MKRTATSHFGFASFQPSRENAEKFSVCIVIQHEKTNKQTKQWRKSESTQWVQSLSQVIVPVHLFRKVICASKLRQRRRRTAATRGAEIGSKFVSIINNAGRWFNCDVYLLCLHFSRTWLWHQNIPRKTFRCLWFIPILIFHRPYYWNEWVTRTIKKLIFLNKKGISILQLALSLVLVLAGDFMCIWNVNITSPFLQQF